MDAILRGSWSRLVAVAAIALLLTACGRSSESDFVGTWELDREAFGEGVRSVVVAVADPQERDFALSMVSAIVSEASGSLEFRQDGTYAVQLTVMGETIQESGTWVAEGAAVTMDVVNSHGTREVTTGRLDGGLLRLEPDDPNDPPVVFRKR
jgi:hypothetical protein